MFKLINIYHNIVSVKIMFALWPLRILIDDFNEMQIFYRKGKYSQ